MGFPMENAVYPDPLKQAMQVIFSVKKVNQIILQYILMGKKLSLKPSKST